MLKWLFLLLLSYPDECQGYAGTVWVPWPMPGVCRYRVSTLTNARGMQVLCEYPDQCQGYAGTLWVPRPMPGICRYPVSTLTNARHMQVPCEYPDQCQRYADTLWVPDQCQGYAGTLWVPWPMLGVCNYDFLVTSAYFFMPHRPGYSLGGFITHFLNTLIYVFNLLFVLCGYSLGHPHLTDLSGQRDQGFSSNVLILNQALQSLVWFHDALLIIATPTLRLHALNTSLSNSLDGSRFFPSQRCRPDFLQFFLGS